MTAPRGHAPVAPRSEPVRAGAAAAEVLSELPDPLVILDRGDRIVFANAAAEQFLGASAAWLRLKPLDQIAGLDGRLGVAVRHARATRRAVKEFAIELRLPRAGTARVDLQATPPDAQGSVLVLLHPGALAERQVAAPRASAVVLGNLGAVLAHEVNNPLSGIRGAAQLIEQGAPDESTAALAVLIREEVDRIAGLIERFVRFSELTSRRHGAVNIHEILDHVRRVAEAGFARGRRLSVRYDPSLPPVWGARDELVQVFLNLVKNAAEASGECGDIVIATRFEGGVRTAVPGAGAWQPVPIEVCVTDDGPGISPDVADTLFDPFVSTKPGSMGLGLPLVAKLVTAHGGTIEAGAEGGRTVFRVRLPMADTAAEGPGTP
ncbi:MAG: PAS domain-containing protein [Alphaproteobacteria bacterium]|nr:PAS domain-containing protein [Alphaproteobacteria bacterium]